MPTQLLPLGPPVTMLAGIAYALPAVNCTLFTDAAAPTLTQSTTPSFTVSSPITLTGGQSAVSGGFIKAAADTLVILKRN
jgi:hypothetical protein